MPFWHRLIVVGVVMFVTIVVARLIDRRIARRDLPPEAITRYRVVRRSVTTTIIFIGLLDGMAWLLKMLLPNRIQETDPSRPRYLDESALETPSLALADTSRETLRMGDAVETMLRKVMTATFRARKYGSTACVGPPSGSCSET